VTSFLIRVRTVHLLVFLSLSFSSVFGSRFHEDVKNTLETRKADVIELYQHLTEPMEAIHHAIVQCMTVTLSELKRSNKTVSIFELALFAPERILIHLSRSLSLMILI
jgi:hypothetical protein